MVKRKSGKSGKMSMDGPQSRMPRAALSCGTLKAQRGREELGIYF